VILVVIIFFYYFFKISVSKDNKDYKNNHIFINDYTLVLQNLKIISDDYDKEISDLISFLNTLLQKYEYLFISNNESNKEEFNFNIFDISISNVNEKKIKAFKKIKSLQNKNENILNDNDTIKQKIKNKIKDIFKSVHDIAVNITNNEEKNHKNIIDINSSGSFSNSIEISSYDEGKKNKIGINNSKITEKKSKITIDILKLHKEYNLKNYVDIYITFKNKLIQNFIYRIYNKNIFIRFFYYIFCQKHKLAQFYYKNQWLNFNLAIENPSDVQWENCYISKCKKFLRRFLSIFISFLIIVVITVIDIWMNIKSLQDSEEVDIIMITRLKVYVIQIINIFSSFVLNKLTNFEKHTSKSKEISSNISKYFWLNILIQITVLFHSKCLLVFSYYDVENYYILSKTIILNMIYSILTSQISQIFFYFWNLLKRFGDSKYNNGKTTKLTDKKKYEKIYLGPEFPFAEKYAKILVNLFVCLLFGVNSPVLNFFFACFLIVTFLVDKFLIINYYKKPLFYGEFLSKTLISYLFFRVFLFIVGLFFIFQIHIF
jgi:hypothetical protein